MTPPPRHRFGLVLVLLGLAAGGLFFLQEHLRGNAALAGLRKAGAAMRGNLEAKGEALLRDLQTKLKGITGTRATE